MSETACTHRISCRSTTDLTMLPTHDEDKHSENLMLVRLEISNTQLQARCTLPQISSKSRLIASKCTYCRHEDRADDKNCARAARIVPTCQKHVRPYTASLLLNRCTVLSLII